MLHKFDIRSFVTCC